MWKWVIIDANVMCYFFQVTYLHFNRRQFKGGYFNCCGRWVGTYFELWWIWEPQITSTHTISWGWLPSLQEPRDEDGLLGLCGFPVLWECWTPSAMMDETSVPWWAITNNSLLQNGLTLISPEARSLMWHSAISQILRHTLEACITFYRARKPELQKTMEI